MTSYRTAIAGRASAICVLTLAAIMASSARVYGQPTFVYTNNDAVANSVSAFRVGPGGTLTEIANSPFLTGGSGTGAGLFASNRATVGILGRWLFAANTASDSISVFNINFFTGNLTPVTGSPFPSFGVGLIGLSLGVTPNNKFLYAANSFSETVTVFRIAPNGALMLPPVDIELALGTPDGLKVAPNGGFLSVALPASGAGAVAMFRIAFDGSLTPVPGSPFPDGGLDGAATGVDINCSTRFVFAAETNVSRTIVDVFRIATNGTLTPRPGSPFEFFSGADSGVAVLSPNDRFLFVSNQISNEITVLRVGSTGGLTLVPGSPFANPNVSGIGPPAGMATNITGTLLYVANNDNSVTGFRVASTGALTPVPGSPFATGEPGGLLSLAVFPPKVCAPGGHDDDDDHDDDGDRDDHDNDDDNDGKHDDEDDDDDNDGEHDLLDADDDNDWIEDVFDSKSHREIQTVIADELGAGQERSYDLANDGTGLVLIAAAEAIDVQLLNQPLRVEIYDPNGRLVGTSPPTPGRAIATAVPLLAGTYKVKVRNSGLSTIRYDQLRIVRQAWLP